MKEENRVSTIEELRNDTLLVREQLLKRQIDIPLAKEVNNSTGKIIKTCLLQLEYAKMCKVEPDIKFLEDSGK